jgi:hypothetical protein
LACRSSTRSGSSSAALTESIAVHPGPTHIHHRLLDLGLSHRNTVLFIYAICIALGVLSLLVQEVTQAYAFISLFILAGLVLFGPTRGAFARPRSSKPSRTTTRSASPRSRRSGADGLVSGGRVGPDREHQTGGPSAGPRGLRSTRHSPYVGATGGRC